MRFPERVSSWPVTYHHSTRASSCDPWSRGNERLCFGSSGLKRPFVFVLSMRESRASISSKGKRAAAPARASVPMRTFSEARAPIRVLARRRPFTLLRKITMTPCSACSRNRHRPDGLRSEANLFLLQCGREEAPRRVYRDRPAERLAVDDVHEDCLL